eukprot:tig00021435_g21440.t1
MSGLKAELGSSEAVEKGLARHEDSLSPSDPAPLIVVDERGGMWERVDHDNEGAWQPLTSPDSGSMIMNVELIAQRQYRIRLGDGAPAPLRVGASVTLSLSYFDRHEGAGDLGDQILLYDAAALVNGGEQCRSARAPAEKAEVRLGPSGMSELPFGVACTSHNHEGARFELRAAYTDSGEPLHQFRLRVFTRSRRRATHTAIAMLRGSAPASGAGAGAGAGRGTPGRDRDWEASVSRAPGAAAARLGRGAKAAAGGGAGAGPKRPRAKAAAEAEAEVEAGGPAAVHVRRPGLPSEHSNSSPASTPPCAYGYPGSSSPPLDPDPKEAGSPEPEPEPDAPLLDLLALLSLGAQSAELASLDAFDDAEQLLRRINGSAAASSEGPAETSAAPAPAPAGGPHPALLAVRGAAGAAEERAAAAGLVAAAAGASPAPFPLPTGAARGAGRDDEGLALLYDAAAALCAGGHVPSRLESRAGALSSRGCRRGTPRGPASASAPPSSAPSPTSTSEPPRPGPALPRPAPPRPAAPAPPRPPRPAPPRPPRPPRPARPARPAPPAPPRGPAPPARPAPLRSAPRDPAPPRPPRPAPPRAAPSRPAPPRPLCADGRAGRFSRVVRDYREALACAPAAEINRLPEADFVASCGMPLCGGARGGAALARGLRAAIALHRLVEWRCGSLGSN